MWNNCKKILCIRADNMGDVVMTTPALRALKETFGAHITLLTSSLAQGIAPFIPVIDDVIVADLPWVKNNHALDGKDLIALAENLRSKDFEAVVIFTVYSQSALPAALLALQAGIPRRLAYSRENPYGLLTDWVPDPEPYRIIRHQVERDLQLVNAIGAFTRDEHLHLQPGEQSVDTLQHKLKEAGTELLKHFYILHPGVSEQKRQYPENYWIGIGKALTKDHIPLIVTGAKSERELAGRIVEGIGPGAFNVAGLLDIGEFIALIGQAALVISVNTATVHIAAATQTPVIVLYALTNPQHTPWKVKSKVLYFSVETQLRSRNEVVTYVQEQHFREHIPFPSPEEVIRVVRLF